MECYVHEGAAAGTNLLLIYNWIVDMKLIIDSVEMGSEVAEGKLLARSQHREKRGTSVNRMQISVVKWALRRLKVKKVVEIYGFSSRFLPLWCPRNNINANMMIMLYAGINFSHANNMARVACERAIRVAFKARAEPYMTSKNTVDDDMMMKHKFLMHTNKTRFYANN